MARIEPYQWIINLGERIQEKLGDQTARLSPRELNKIAKLFYPICRPITLEDYGKDPAPFIEKDFEEHKVKKMSMTSNHSTFNHIMDFIAAKFNNGEDPTNYIMGSQSVLSLSMAADEYFAKQVKDATVDGKTRTLKKIGGYEFVQLLDEQAYRFEGRVMDNCVGSYWARHKHHNEAHAPMFGGGTAFTLVSVRKNGQSVATIEYKMRTVYQIEAPDNKPVVNKRLKSAILRFFGVNPRTYENDQGWNFMPQAAISINPDFLRNTHAQG